MFSPSPANQDYVWFRMPRPATLADTDRRRRRLTRVHCWCRFPLWRGFPDCRSRLDNRIVVDAETHELWVSDSCWRPPASCLRRACSHWPSPTCACESGPGQVNWRLARHIRSGGSPVQTITDDTGASSRCPGRRHGEAGHHGRTKPLTVDVRPSLLQVSISPIPNRPGLRMAPDSLAGGSG